MRAEQKVVRGKRSKKLLRLRRKVAGTRLEIARAISTLSLKEDARQRLIAAIAARYKEVRTTEREIDKLTEKLNKKRIKPEDAKEYKRLITAAKRRLKQGEADTFLSPVEVK